MINLDHLQKYDGTKVKMTFKKNGVDSITTEGAIAVFNTCRQIYAGAYAQYEHITEIFIAKTGEIIYSKD